MEAVAAAAAPASAAADVTDAATAPPSAADGGATPAAPPTSHAEGQAFSSLHGLNKDQVERYSRHLLLPCFGVGGQGKLCASRALIVGCGGLGCPAALYLAAAGVGTLGLVDHDVVELSNMHRQVIHTEARLGQHKATSAAAAVAALNSSVAVVTHLEGLHPGNAVDIISGYDVVLDASDNPPSRYLISDACVACGVPLVSAAAVGTDGQLTVYNHGPAGPCYRCLFPECPAPANCARCADAGVLGPVPGVLGVLQALEAVKLLSGCGDVLSGRLLLFDALAGRFTSIKLRGRAPGCIACGPQHQMTRDSIAAYDYTAFTGGQRANDGPPVPLKVLPPEQRITPLQLRDMLQPAGRSQAAAKQQQEPGAAREAEEESSAAAGAGLVLLDVRPPEQFAVMALPGAVNVPFLKLEQQLADVLQLCGAEQQQEEQQPSPSSSGQQQAEAMQQAGGAGAKRVVVMCRRGNHSQLAVRRLRELGVAAVDVGGGYEAWAAEVDASMPVL